VGALLSKRAFRGLKKRVDYSEYGGAPLLGVRGACIICHGRSNPNAIKNAIRVAREFCENKINQRIEANLAGMLSGERVAQVNP
jgi:glycerol-3-phosphate acyltransferase PlsX